MNTRTWLRLGRVSNLPTVVTNSAVGLLLMSDAVHGSWLLVPLAMALFYVGGMFLNDAFDRQHDLVFAPSRPIPSGEVDAGSVFTWGGAQMLLGLILIVAVASWRAQPIAPALMGALSLAGTIVLYDVWHKKNPLSPLLMASCRALVVVTAALAVAGAPQPQVLLATAALSAHLIGLTYAAKQEHLRTPGHWWPLLFLFAPVLWGALNIVGAAPYLAALVIADVTALRRLYRRAPGDVPFAVALLIAAISLVDAMSLAIHGHALAAALCSVCFALTLLLQRWVRGT